MTNSEREARIDALALILGAATSQQARADAWAEMRILIAQRPPEYVRKMERERGLRNG